MYGTFLDGNNPMRSTLVMSHDKPPAARARAKDERNFVSKMPGCLVVDRNEQWRRERVAHRFRQTLSECGFFRRELFGIRKMLKTTAATYSEVTTHPLCLKRHRRRSLSRDLNQIPVATLSSETFPFILGARRFCRSPTNACLSPTNTLQVIAATR
jgi:hypothetical protein